MPGVTARSISKNMSKRSRAKADKNTRRVDAALNNTLDHTTYGKITKALGNKMFLATKTDKVEHICYIRGKMVRVNVGDIVLLNERDYESRHNGNTAVYDIMAIFSAKDISKLIRSETIPNWMSSGANTEDLDDLFDYEGAEEDSDEIDIDNI